MEEEKIKNKNILVGYRMVELIDRVMKNFRKKYGFTPKIIDATNLIADRVNENSLFD